MPNGTSSFEAVYEKGSVLGRGASGVAYIVRSKRDPRLQYVAKEICVARTDEKRRREAFAESQLLRTLSHEHIVACLDVFQEQDLMHIVMEYANGGDLSRRIQHQRAEGRLLTEHTVMGLFVQICTALHYIHSRKVLHRDLKPPNIFVVGEGELGTCALKLGDFGIAKLIDSTLGQVNSTVGTPSYLSPEICKNHPYGIKADVWSLGVVLYELACLKVPFHAGNLPAMALMICTSEPKPVPDEYGSELSVLVKALLQKEPNNRPMVSAVLQRPYVRGYLPDQVRAYFEGLAAKAKPEAQTGQRTSSLPTRPSRTAEGSAPRLPSCGLSARQRQERALREEETGNWCWQRPGESEQRPSERRLSDKGRPASPGASIGRREPTHRGAGGQRSDRGERGSGEHLDRAALERLDRWDRSEPDHPEKPDRVDRAERFERADRRSERRGSERSGRPERAERVGRGYRGSLGEGRGSRGEQGVRGSSEHSGTRGGDGSRGDQGSRGSDQSGRAEHHHLHRGEIGDSEILASWNDYWAVHKPRQDKQDPFFLGDSNVKDKQDPFFLGESNVKAMWQVGDMAMESIIATPENSGLADSDEDLTGTGFTDSSSTAAQVSPPAEFQEPLPPGAGPPTSNSILTAMWPTNSDTQTRAPRRNRRRGRPPLLAGQESVEVTIVQPGSPPKPAPDSVQGPAPAVPHPASSSSYVPPAMLQPPSSSLAPVVARSVSPTRPEKFQAMPVASMSQPSSGNLSCTASAAPLVLPLTELPPPPLLRVSVPRPDGEVLRVSGSAPSLPPLPPLLAPSGPSRERIPRSRSVVAIHDSRGTHSEVNQVLQRPTPQHFRAAPIKGSPEDFRHQQDCGPSGVGTGSLPPPPSQPPPPQRQSSELGQARLAPKLPLALVGQAGRSKVSSRSDQLVEDAMAAGRLAAWSPEQARELPVQDGRHWRDLGILAQGRGVHEGWAEAAAREADARLSVV